MSEIGSKEDEWEGSTPDFSSLRGRWLSWSLALALLFAPALASGQVRGLVSGPGQTSFPIIVSPLAGGDAASAVFGKTLRRDLEISGFFRVLPVTATAEPDVDGQVAYRRWSEAGARFLVAGTYRSAGSGFAIEVRLYDVIEGRIVGGKAYQGPVSDLPRMAHRFADEILRLVTGEPGPFDTEIAFISTREGKFKELWVMGFDGGGLRQLTRNQTINISPSWAPGGKSLLYTSYRDGRPGLYEVDVATQRRRRVLGGAGLVVGGVYSPSGREIAVAREEARGDTEIVILENSGRTLGVVARDQAIDVSPTWAPDGRRLAFCSSRGGTPQIYVADLGAGGPPRRVTYQGSYNTAPAWSPRGDRIAYIGRVGGTFQIFVLELATGRTRQITAGPGDNTDPSWAPDGRFLVFSSTRAGRAELYVTDWLGRRAHRLITGPGGDTSPAWSPRLG